MDGHQTVWTSEEIQRKLPETGFVTVLVRFGSYHVYLGVGYLGVVLEDVQAGTTARGEQRLDRFAVQMHGGTHRLDLVAVLTGDINPSQLPVIEGAKDLLMPIDRAVRTVSV